MPRLAHGRLALSVAVVLLLTAFGGGAVIGATPRATSGIPVAPLKCMFPPNCEEPTDTYLSSGTNPSHYGQSVRITAVVMIWGGRFAGGLVDFNEGTTSLCTAVPLTDGRAHCTVRSLDLGDHLIHARYRGNADTHASENTLVQTVRNTGTRTIMGSSSEISRFGQPVVLSALVYSPISRAIKASGRFQFRVDGVDVGTPVTLNADGRGFLLANLGVGPHWVDGRFLGNRLFRPSTPVRLFQDVLPAVTKTTLAVTPSTADAGDTLILSATVDASSPGSGIPDGTVQFYLDGVAFRSPRTLVSGHTHLTLTHGLAPGAHTFRAVYAGSASFVGSESPSVGKTFHR